MKYLAIVILICQLGFSQKLRLNDTLGKNTDTIKVGDKIKMRFYSDTKLKINQFLRWDGDSTTYFFQTKIVAIDSLKIVVKHKKDSLSIPISKIFEIRKYKLRNFIISRVATNAPIGIVTSLVLFPTTPFLLPTIGAVIVGEFAFRATEPIFFPSRKLVNKRYSLVYLKNSN
jgi:hypothetical protein